MKVEVNTQNKIANLWILEKMKIGYSQND